MLKYLDGVMDYLWYVFIIALALSIFINFGFVAPLIFMLVILIPYFLYKLGVYFVELSVKK